MKPYPENWTPERIVALRRKLGVSQSDFGIVIGSDQRVVSRLENGADAVTSRTAIVFTYVERFGPLAELAPKPRPEPKPKKRYPYKSQAKRSSRRARHAIEKALKAASR